MKTDDVQTKPQEPVTPPDFSSKADDSTIASIRSDVKPTRAEPTAPPEYPFDKMKPGESFGVKNSSVAAMATPVTAANRKDSNKWFYAESVDPKTDPDQANVRVWRKR